MRVDNPDDRGDGVTGGSGERLRCASLSHVGCVRARNEDAVWVDEAHGWLLLADGMGGYRGGDVAAALTISQMLHCLQDRLSQDPPSEVRAEALLQGVVAANSAIRCTAMGMPELAGMGATLVAAVLDRRHLVHVHVGDSRLYRLRRGVLTCLTRDHTVLQEQIDAGMIDASEAGTLSYRGLLTRGVGVAEEVVPDIGVHPLQAGDRFLLCSDGLTDMLVEAEIAGLLSGALEPEEAAQALVEAAIAHGGRDNVSVIIAWFAG